MTCVGLRSRFDDNLCWLDDVDQLDEPSRYGSGVWVLLQHMFRYVAPAQAENSTPRIRIEYRSVDHAG